MNDTNISLERDGVTYYFKTDWTDGNRLNYEDWNRINSNYNAIVSIISNEWHTLSSVTFSDDKEVTSYPLLSEMNKLSEMANEVYRNTYPDPEYSPVTKRVEGGVVWNSTAINFIENSLYEALVFIDNHTAITTTWNGVSSHTWGSFDTNAWANFTSGIPYYESEV